MKTIQRTFVWMATAILLGAICGAFGTLFSNTIALATEFRATHSYILYLLPVGGILTILLYRLCRTEGVGTTQVFDCVHTDKALPLGLAPAIFIATAFSHFFGASAGREGAALQIGGGIAGIWNQIFKLDKTSRKITTMCGMAALFSAVFGTPLAAFAFVLEVLQIKTSLWSALLVLLSSVTAFFVSSTLGAKAERFVLGTLPKFSLSLIGKSLVILLACLLTAFLFFQGLRYGKQLFKRIFPNQYLRICTGAVLLILLTLCVGNYDYNGGGIPIIEHVFEGHVVPMAFAFKILFTIISISSGYKGGEIIPTLFIGATAGGSLASVLGLPMGSGAAIGMAVLFTAGTKCPIATLLLCAEMFGFSSIPLLLPVIGVSFLLARFKGLYNN